MADAAQPVSTEQELVGGLDPIALEPPWQTVTITQTGPDGTQTLALLIFYVCPVCACVVSPTNPGGGSRTGMVYADDQGFVDEHRAWHLDVGH